MDDSTNPSNMDVHYPSNMIPIYEKIWGRGWITPGGEASAKEFFPNLGLRPGQRVLDIGSGLGGTAFYLARHYGVHVQGVDCSSNMIRLATQRLNSDEDSLSGKINFTMGDILSMEFETNSFDAVYSRDVFVHIKDKESVLKKIKIWLKPGGKLLIIDNCKGDVELSDEFIQYANDREYSLLSVKEYGKIVKDAGFDILEIFDIRDKFSSHHEEDLKNIAATKEASIQEFGKEIFDTIHLRWKQKIKQCSSKERGWVYLLSQATTDPRN